MTARGFYTLLFGLLMLATALSVSSEGAFLLGCAALIAWALALLSVLLALFTCRISQEAAGGQPLRGVPCAFRLSVRMGSILPIAPLSLRVTLPSGRVSEFMLPVRTIGTTHSENEFACPHVGVYPVGVTRVRFGDCFGLFSLGTAIRTPLPELTVLPNPAQAQPLEFSPGEGESSTVQRALADLTTPSDTRAGQEGDELKRVHWKLSLRKQTLMVRTYETPQRPDALILLDFSTPDTPAALRAGCIDALTEGCAGVIRLLLEEQHAVHMPLPGKGARELSGERMDAFAGMQMALARERFAQRIDFARTLYAAARRMRRTGSAVILTTTLTPAVADAAIALRRTGPRTRFYLYTASEPTQEQSKLLHLLASSDVQTEHAVLR